MLQSIYHIARNTFRECIRQPIYVILLLTTQAIIGNYPVMALYVFREQEKMVTDGALATVMVFGWITAVLCASHAIAREIDTGTVLLILSKPVNRAVFIIAKVIGILTALTLFVWITGIAVMLALRMAVDQFRFDIYIYSTFFAILFIACGYGALMNYLKKSSFSAQATTCMAVLYGVMLVVVFFVPEYSYGSYTDHYPRYSANLVLAILLVLFSVWAMGTLATALSTQFSLVANLSICAIFFLLGLMSDYFHLQLRELKLEQVLQAMHLWYFILLPFFLGFWILTAKHFADRRLKRIGKWELHLSFALINGALLIRGIHALNHKIYLQEPSTALQAAARFIYVTKNQIADVLHALIPNWQLFWMADALAAGKMIPLHYLGFGIVYIFLFIGMFTVLAFGLFAYREVGRQMIR